MVKWFEMNEVKELENLVGLELLGPHEEHAGRSYETQGYYIKDNKLMRTVAEYELIRSGNLYKKDDKIISVSDQEIKRFIRNYEEIIAVNIESDMDRQVALKHLAPTFNFPRECDISTEIAGARRFSIQC